MMYKHAIFVICAVLFSDNGAATESSKGLVAFSANIKQARDYPANEIVKFDNVVTNDGNAYNKDTGIFTAPKPGLYVFHFSTLSIPGGLFLFDLFHNNEILASAYESQPSTHGQGGPLRRGDHLSLVLLLLATLIIAPAYSFGPSGSQCVCRSFSNSHQFSWRRPENGLTRNLMIVRVKSGDHVYVKVKVASRTYNAFDRPFSTFSGYFLSRV